MFHFGYFISPYAKATRAILNHAQIGNYRAMKMVPMLLDILSI